MNQFHKPPQGGGERKNDRETVRISELEVQEYASLMENVKTNEERKKIIRIAMLSAATDAVIAANSVIVENSKSLAQLLTPRDSDVLSDLLIKISSLDDNSRVHRDKLDKLREELGLPLKFRSK